jgi:DNA-binding NarL/FixJ family response regulator
MSSSIAASIRPIRTGCRSRRVASAAGSARLTLTRVDADELGQTVVDKAADGAAAVEPARAHRPRVVPMNVRMPGGAEG